MKARPLPNHIDRVALPFLRRRYWIDKLIRSAPRVVWRLMPLPLPGADLRVHVEGKDDPELFLKSGKSVYLQMGQALRKYTDCSFGDFHRILDFGVGCGRLERWFSHRTLRRLTGVDVNQDAIEFCSNCLYGRYLPIAPDPPLPFADHQFDLVLSFSVFSHMEARYARTWIEELHRVTRPGAILLITTHMEWCVETLLDAESQAEFTARGMLVIPYAASDGHHDRYVNTYFSRPAWRKLWSDKFELIGMGYGREAHEFAPDAGDNDNQDLLPMGQALSVFRRKS